MLWGNFTQSGNRASHPSPRCSAGGLTPLLEHGVTVSPIFSPTGARKRDARTHRAFRTRRLANVAYQMVKWNVSPAAPIHSSTATTLSRVEGRARYSCWSSLQCRSLKGWLEDFFVCLFSFSLQGCEIVRYHLLCVSEQLLSESNRKLQCQLHCTTELD